MDHKTLDKALATLSVAIHRFDGDTAASPQWFQRMAAEGLKALEADGLVIVEKHRSHIERIWAHRWREMEWGRPLPLPDDLSGLVVVERERFERLIRGGARAVALNASKHGGMIQTSLDELGFHPGDLDPLPEAR